MREVVPLGNYSRANKRGYVDSCTKCLARAPRPRRRATEGVRRAKERLADAGSYLGAFSSEGDAGVNGAVYS